MAGYSGTPLTKKLGIKPGARVLLWGAPDGFETDLEPLPEGVDLRRRLASGIDVALLFVTTRKDLERRFATVAARVPPAGSIWVAWPKKSSGMSTDLTENLLREVVLPTGFVDTKVCAVTDVWSGLRFVRRLSHR